MEAQETKVAEEQKLERVLAERDEEGFRELVQRYMDALLRVARHELDYYVFENYVRPSDFTAEELVGEALIHAWEQLPYRPKEVSLRGWLLGIEYRTVTRLVEQNQVYRDERAISLDEPLPINPDNMDVQEWFWEWYQPETDMTWEDVVPDVEPVDAEIPLYDVRDTFALDPETRHVLMLHDEFDVPLTEISLVMNRAVNEAAELINQARTLLRERLASSEPNGGSVAHPAPPDGSDE